jgi:hypothetical protein
MEIKQYNGIFATGTEKKDSIDMPDCFGEYNKKSRLCGRYCSISIKCCVMHTRNPKIDVLEKLLLHNNYAVKPH